MADMLSDAAAWLADQRRAFMSKTVTYQRGQEEVDLPATVGQTVFRITDDYGASIRHVTRDFLIAADDLVLGGAATEPKRGDRIRETIGGITFVHEVMGVGGEPEWRYSDPFRGTYRIHTKQIDQEPAP
jgi:hypothetical protein